MWLKSLDTGTAEAGSARIHITRDLNFTTPNEPFFDIYLLEKQTDGSATATQLFKFDYTGDLDLLVGDLLIGGTEVITSGRVLQNIASVGQNLIPSADNTYDLGSSSYRWSIGYFSRLVVGHSLDDNGTYIEYSPGTPTTTRTLFGVGDTTQSPNYVIYWVRDTTPQDYLKLGADWCPVQFRGDTYPNADATYDLGSASYRWKNVYTNYVNGGNAATLFITNYSNVIRLSSAERRILLDPASELGGSDNAYVDFFRNTNTTGSKYIRIFAGDGTATQTARISSTGLAELTGLHIGTAVEGTIQIDGGYRWLGLRTRNSNYDWLIGDDSSENFEISLYDVAGDTYSWGLFEIKSDTMDTYIRTILNTYNLKPTADDTYNLGTSGYRWKYLYLSKYILRDGSGKIIYSTLSGYDTLELYRDDNGAMGIYNRTDGAWLFRVHQDGDFVSVKGNLRPTSDSTYSLGESGYQWKNIWYSNAIVHDGITLIDDYQRLRGVMMPVDNVEGINYYDINDLTFRADLRYTVTVTPSPSGGSIANMFENMARYAFAEFDSAPITIEIDFGTTIHYWRGCIIYLTRHGGTTGNVDEIKVEYLDSRDDTWYEWCSATDTNVLVYNPGSTRNYVKKFKITISATLDAGETIRVRKVSFYNFYVLARHGTISTPFLTKAGGYLYGWLKIGDNIEPITDNAYDLGSSSYRWNTAYFANDIRISDGAGLRSTAGARIATGGGGQTFQTWAGGSSADAFAANIYDGTQVFRIISDGTVITRSVRPMTDNAYDLGSSSYRWRNIYVSGVVEVKHDGVTLRSLTPSSANQTAGCGISWQEEGSSTYWLMQKRGSQRATEPDYLFISYYDGSAWHQYLTFRAGTDILKIKADTLPSGDATWDLGSSSYRWRNLYLSTANSLLELLARHKGPFWFNSHWLPSGMMTYATTGSGTVSWYDNYVGLDTGTTSDSTVKTYKRFYGFNNTYSWDKKRVFGAEVYFSSYTNQVVWIVSGWITDITASSATDRHIGFKLVNDTLYGTVADGTTEATLTLETLSSDAHRTLEYVYTPGSEVRFYVDGVDKGAITTNLPSGTINALYALFASVYNSAAEQKRLNIYDIRVIQEE